MDARPKTRRVNRERKAVSGQAPRGAKQIVIPMTREEYDQLWPHAQRVRACVDAWAEEFPELFPADFSKAMRCTGLDGNPANSPT